MVRVLGRSEYKCREGGWKDIFTGRHEGRRHNGGGRETIIKPEKKEEKEKNREMN